MNTISLHQGDVGPAATNVKAHSTEHNSHWLTVEWNLGEVEVIFFFKDEYELQRFFDKLRDAEKRWHDTRRA